MAGGHGSVLKNHRTLDVSIDSELMGKKEYVLLGRDVTKVERI